MFDNLKTMVAAARSGVSFSTFASAKRGMSLGELPQAVIVFGIAAITQADFDGQDPPRNP